MCEISKFINSSIPSASRNMPPIHSVALSSLPVAQVKADWDEPRFGTYHLSPPPPHFSHY